MSLLWWHCGGFKDANGTARSAFLPGSGPPASVPAMNKISGFAPIQAGTWAFIALLIACSYLCGCAASSNQTRPDSGARAVGPYVPPQPSQTQSVRVTPSLGQSCSVPAIVSLWRRRADAPVRDFPVGPGDVIDISVPEIDELQNQKVRVSAEGTIELPLVGTVEAAGLGENELHNALVQKLKVYMKNPRVELFVENYRSRGVAVMGAVQKPGYYDLADERESLVAMIGLAGGLSSGAAQKVIFSPAQRKDLASNASNPETYQLASAVSQPPSPTPGGGAPLAASVEPRPLPESADAILPSADGPADHSIVLNIDAGGDAGCLGMPARPGDVLIVPVAGQVMVQGWVGSPGAFAITPGMTILGAVAAAGGAVFSWWAELLRTDQAGGKTITHYALSQLESGEAADPLVQSGDIILVQKTVVGAVPYTLYEVFQHFGTGVGLPVF
jgi:protein involved in polysaccharide export with SLBB domain